jgi:hypothetical protein
MVSNKKAMVSRSLRIGENTLAVLEKEALHMGIGITVHIRGILEQHVATRQLLDELVAVRNEFEIREALV